MGEQRPEHPVAPPAQRGIQGQVLVRGHVSHQPREQRLHGLTGSGVAPMRPTAAGHLDHGVVGEERQRPPSNVFTTWYGLLLSEQDAARSTAASE